MKRYGLVGFPLGHSFSAKFFAEKFEREGIDAEYCNYEIPSADSLHEIIASDSRLCGLNVTIPHKQAVIPLLDTLSPEAQAIGAVNVICIRREGGRICLEGNNSDAVGFSRSLSPCLRPWHTKALVLGTGGASKAVAYALRALGIAPTYVSRSPRPDGYTYADLTPEILAEYLLVVNCSPVGMFPHVDEAPALPYEALTPRHLLFDLVYNPLETRFLKEGEQRGAQTKSGLEMLHLQALAAWEMWNETSLPQE